LRRSSLNKFLLVISLLLMIFLATPTYTTAQSIDSGIDNIDKEVSDVVRDLEYLYGRGIDVSNLTESLNKLIINWSRDPNNTYYLIQLQKIRSEIDSLKKNAESIYLSSMITRYLVAGLILSVPAVVYFALPRLYLFLWFRSRRRWIVVERRSK